MARFLLTPFRTEYLYKGAYMKKKLSFIAVLFVAMAAVFAGGASETTTIEGKLVVTDSIPMIQGSAQTWVLPAGPFYQIAWENGVKVGDAIKAEGFTRACPADFTVKNAVFLMPTKVWVNGKEIDLSTVRRPMMGNGRGNGMGNGNGPCRDGDDKRGRNQGRDEWGW